MPRENWKKRIKKNKFDIKKRILIGLDSESKEDGRLLMKILANDLRLDILEYINKKEKGVNISNLCKDINKTRSEKNQLDYKAFLFHLKVLENAGFIIMKKKQNEKGRPVIIKTKEPKPIFLLWGGLKFPIAKVTK